MGKIPLFLIHRKYRSFSFDLEILESQNIVYKMGKGESSYQSILQPQKVLAYSSFCRMPIELLKKILTQAESERASDPWLEPYIAARLFDEETKKRVLKISPSDSQTW